MEAEFWHERWREGRIGFHLEVPNPALVRHWPALALPAGARILVPLCGKSVDMGWLADQGLTVLGVELSELAVTQYFEEAGERPTREETAVGPRYRCGNVALLAADFMRLSPAETGVVNAVYDRAALIALPESMRPAYVHKLESLAPSAPTLLVTLDHEGDRTQGPPFAVSDAEVRRLYAHRGEVRVLECRDVLHSEPRFRSRGIERLDQRVYLVR